MTAPDEGSQEKQSDKPSVFTKLMVETNTGDTLFAAVAAVCVTSCCQNRNQTGVEVANLTSYSGKGFVLLPFPYFLHNQLFVFVSLLAASNMYLHCRQKIPVIQLRLVS